MRILLISDIHANLEALEACLGRWVLSIDAEEWAPRAGTTTFVDGGSSGSLNFQAFREHVIEPDGEHVTSIQPRTESAHRARLKRRPPGLPPVPAPPGLDPRRPSRRPHRARPQLLPERPAHVHRHFLPAFALDEDAHLSKGDEIQYLSRVALISRKARHPDAARLFLDYLLSVRGQKVLANGGSVYVLRPEVGGDLCVAGVTKALGPAVQPIPVGPPLLEYLDQAKRLDFLKKWQQALAGK